MAAKKTYYDPQNGQHYYHGEKLGAANWAALESQKDESYINQYNYTPSYNAYRQYLEEERRRQEEEERRREQWQRIQVENGQSVKNFDTERARAKYEDRTKAEQAYQSYKDQLEREEFLARTNPQASSKIKEGIANLPGQFSDLPEEKKYDMYTEDYEKNVNPGFYKWQKEMEGAPTKRTEEKKIRTDSYMNFANDVVDAAKGKVKSLVGLEEEKPKEEIIPSKRTKKEIEEFSKLNRDEKYNMYIQSLEQKALENGTLSQEERNELSQYKYDHLTDEERNAVDVIMAKEAADTKEFGEYGLFGGMQSNDYAQKSGKMAKEAQDAVKTLKSLGWEDRDIDRFKELADYNATQELNDYYKIDPNASSRDKFLKSVENTAMGVYTAPGRGLGSLLSENGAYGKNLSSKYRYPVNMSQAAYGQVKENVIGNDHPIGQLAYDAGVASAESLLTMHTLGGALGGAGVSATAGKALSLIPFATNAYDSSYEEAVNRGFGEGQAQLYGLASGLIEAGTEVFSLDKMWDMASAKKIGRNLVSSAIIQAGIEGSEEVASELAGRIADYLAVEIGGTGKTQRQLDIEEYMQEHPYASSEEAANYAAKKFAQEVGMAGLSGMISAVPDTAVSSAIGAYRSKYGNNLTQAISDRYKDLNVEGDTAYENKLREDKAKYENNPTQYLADNYKVNSEEDARVKQGLEEIAQKEREGKKLSVSDKSFITENVLANKDQFNQEFLDNLYDTGEDSVVPYKYREVKTEVTEDEARKMLAEAAASGDAKAFIEAQRKTRNSTIDDVANRAEEIIDFYSGMAQEHGITKEDIGKALIAEKQAYMAGLRGEELDKSMLTNESQIAYNDGKMDALNQHTRTTIDTQDALKTDVTTKEGNTVKLDGVFTSDGIQTSEGVVAMDNLDLDENKATNKAYHFADNYESVNVKNNFLNNIKDGQNIEKYNTEYGKVYDSAIAGLSLENVKKRAYTELDEEQIENIYETAVVERQARAAESFAEAFNGTKGTGTGKAFNESSSTDPKMLKIASMMARATKYDIHLVDEVPQNKGARGAFLKSDNAVYVRADDFMRSLGHEFSHYIETYNKGEYDSLRNAVANFAASKMGSDAFMGAVKSYGQLYKAGADQKLSTDDISGEMFNDIVPIILESKQGSKALAKYLAENYGAEEARTFGEKIKDVMDNIAGTIKNYLSNADHPTAYAKEMRKYADELGQFADQFIKALDGAIQNYNKGTQGESAGESKVEYSLDVPDSYFLTDEDENDYIRSGGHLHLKRAKARDAGQNIIIKSIKELASSLRNIINTKNLDNISPFAVSRVSDDIIDQIYQVSNGQISAKDFFFQIQPKDFKHSYNEHHEAKYPEKGDLDMSVNDMIYVVAHLNDSDVVMTEDDRQGNKVIMSIDMPDGKMFIVEIVSKTDGALSLKNMWKMTEEGFDAYIEELRNSVDTMESKSPGAIPSHAVSSDLNIAQKGQNSKGKFSLSEDSTGRELSEGQKEYFANSKVRDKNGALKVMHHGTSAYGFDVFDIKKAKAAGLYGRGFYFTDSDSHAGQYGKTYDVYLNIVNPLQPGSNKITDAQMIKFINAIANDEDYGIENYGQNATPQSVLKSLKGKDDFGMLQDINATCIGDFASALKFFNRINNTSYDGIMTPTETVAFYPNQIKDINNKKPTSADSIKFSLSEEEAEDIKKKAKKSKNVDVTKDLVAVHNLGEQQLIETLKLQGLPSPSIAIIRSGMLHDKYGAISLVFNSDTIDPKKSAKNRVYGGDGWTPTFPSVEVKINRSVAEKIWDKIDSLVSQEEQRSIGFANIDTDNLQDRANRNRGDVVEAYKDNKALQYAFLKDNGIDIDVPSEDVRLDEKWTNEQIMAVLDIIKDKAQAESLRGGYKPYEENPELVEQLRQALNKQFRQKYVNKGNAKLFDKDLYEELSFNDFDHLTKGVFKYYREGIQKQMDSQAAKAAIKEQIDSHEEEYMKWLRNLFDGIIEKRGLRNNKDLFLPSGNRRSWEALHDDYTLDNIVRIMNQQEERGEAAFFSQSAIQALSTKKFNSLDEIRKNKGQLRTETEEEHEARINEQSEKFTEICSEIMDKSEPNSFIAFGRASDAIAEAIRRYKTVQGIDRELRQWRGLNIKSDTAQKIVDLMNDIAENPTGYFEAKPRRAVWLDEIKKAVIPDNVSEDTIKALEEAGVPYETYRHEDEGQRRDIIAGTNDVKFSLSYDDIINAIENSLTLEDLEDVEDELGIYANEFHDVAEAKPKEKKPRARHLLRSMLGKEFDVVDGKKIAFTDDRIEKLLKMYGASSKDYAQAYLTYMSPADYLLLTTNGNDGTRSLDRIKNEATPLDVEELKDVYDTQPIFLDLAEKGVGRATKDEIIGHEGRHRMYALQMAGFNQIPVLVFNYDNKYNKTAIDSLDVYPQSFNEDVKYGKNNMVTLTNLQPLSRGNEDNIRQMFGSGQQADLRFSLSEDSEGRELTEGQQRYFNKSQNLDDEGRLKEMYHGTEAGGFTVFDPTKSDDEISLFFTDNEAVAKSYIFGGSRDRIDQHLGRKALDYSIAEAEGIKAILEERGYTNVSFHEKVYDDGAKFRYWDFTTPEGKEIKRFQNKDTIALASSERRGEKSGVYAVYLNTENPLKVDAQNRHFDDIRFETEEGQLNTTREIAEYAKEHGYDGVIFKNLRDNGGGFAFDVENSRKAGKPSTVAIVFSPEQVKSVNNLNPTSSEDIRYALGLEDDWVDFDEMLGITKTEEKAIDILAKGMEALKNQDVDVPKLRTLALKIRNEFGSSYNANKLAEDLRKAFAYMQTEDHVDYPTMMGILRDIARPVIEEAGEKVGEQEYKDFIDYFKGKKIKLTSTQKQDVIHHFGSYGAFRNAMMPITISDNGDTTLDQIWEEMVQASGGMLDIDANEGDMPINLLDTLQAMRPYVRNDFGGDTEDLAKDLAMRIVEEYIEGESSKQMHKELTEYRNRLKKDYQERLKNLKGRANAEVLARNKRRAEQAKERAEVRDLKVKIKQNANKLYTWAAKPTEGKSVPHNMMMPVMQFLQAIDFVDPVITVSEDGKYHIRLFDHMDYEDGHKKFIYKDLVGDTRADVLKQFNEAIGRGEGTKEQRSWTEKMQGIRDIYNKVLNSTDFEDTSMDFLMQSLDAQGLAEEFDDLLSRHKGQADMNNLSSNELKLIDNIIKNIFHAVNQGNKAYSQPSVDIVNLAQSTIHDSEGKEVKTRNKILEGLHKMLRLDNVTPRTFFKLIGKQGHKVYDFLRNGLNQQILDIKQASEYMEGVMKGIDARKWTGNKATLHEVPLSGGTVRLTDGNIMGLYETIRRTGGRERIRGGVEMEIRQKGRLVRSKAIHLTDADIAKLEAMLTPEMIEVANKMQKYMAVDCSKQGNETSRKLYGFEKFTDPTYYPWTVDKETVPTSNTSENIPMFTGIERSGFTKQLKEGANNPLVIRDIFDVFTDHVSQMASYHGYAASVKDTLRWMNYREKQEQDGFVNWITNKKAINALSGSNQGVSYIQRLLLDINKANQSQYIGNFTDALIGNYKAAAVGANLRVVAQQPTAYFRALNMISPKYLLTVNPVTAIRNIKKSQDQSPISWWKSKGYYETNLGQPIKEIVTGIASPMEKAKDIMMAPAGWADDFTWGFLYTAVEKEQRAKYKGQNITPEEFRKAVNDRFDEMVDNTQVVDSTLHRSQYMRSNDRLNKLQTAFMAEPTKSYNMLLESIVEDMRDKSMKRSSRSVAAFLLSALATSAAAAVVDALRKTHDDDDWWEVWLNNMQENMADNLNPFNLLPVVKDVSAGIYNLFTGTSTYGQSGNRFDIEAISSVMDAASTVSKALEGEGTKTGYGIVMSLIKPISQITGIPVYNLTKDSVALYNAFFDNIETTLTAGSKAKNENKKSFVSDVNKEKSEEVLDEGIVSALEHGVSIYDLKGAIQSEYKNKYFDAYAEGNTEEAQAIAERAARAYARMGLSDEDIDEIINGWQEETITYSKLDKAIADGEGIEEEIKHVQEGKEDDKIVKHIMDRYAETIAYEDTHETESDWRGNVEKALQAIDPTLTFDTAHEEAMQKAAEKAEKDAQSVEKKGYKEEFFASVDAKNGSAGRKALDGLKAMGVDAKGAKSMVSTQYHDAWKNAKTQAEKDKARNDWKSAYALVCNYYGVEHKDLDKTWSDWEKDQ